MNCWYEMKELFKNNLNAHSPWWNETEETILAALFDEHGALTKRLRILPYNYIVIPPNTTLKLLP